jgi:Leucine-rich repeat (LRR) protein
MKALNYLFKLYIVVCMTLSVISCGNRISPSMSRHPEKVKELNLVSKNFTVFPQEILNFKNLKTLNLTFNHLATLPTEVSQLSKLEILNLNNNQLQSLPSSMMALNNLRYLTLVNNRLQDLPPEIGMLYNLVYLNLAGNPITEETRERIENMLPRTQIIFSLEEVFAPEKYYLKHSQEMLQQNKANTALRYLDKALFCKPDFAIAFTQRAYVKYYLHDTTGACQDASKALELGDTKADALIQQFCK